MPEPAMSEARRYLLGTVTDAQRDAIEDQYFSDDQTREAIEAEEETLIEEYLAGALSARERQQFERHYLASSVHRQRLAVVRGLTRSTSTASRLKWLAAAAVLLLAIGGAWRFVPRTAPSTPIVVQAPSPSSPALAPAPASPAVFAFALSAINVRGDQPSRTLVIPPGTDVVRLELQQEGTPPTVSDPIVTIRTVAGTDVWRGPAAITGLRAGVLARVDLPAVQLPPNDYFIEIAGFRYFLRVRANP